MFEIDYSELQHENETQEKPKQMKFDKDDRYFLIVFKTKIIIYSIHIGNKSELVQCYTIAHEKYEEIHDVNFISNA